MKAWILLLVVLVGCSRNMNAGGPKTNPKNDPPGEVGVQLTSSLDWSLSMVAFTGEETLGATQSLTLANRGNGATSPLNFNWQNASTVFALDQNYCQNQVLRPQESCEIVISYNPLSVGNKNNLLTVLATNETKSILVAKLMNEELINTPVVVELTLSTPEDTSLTANLVAVDPKGLALTYVLNQGVSHGTVSLNSANGQFIYTPQSNFSGTDSFTFKVINSAGYQSGLATVTIGVVDQNDPPLAQNDAVVTLEDQAILIDVLANDSEPEGEALSLSQIFPPAHGTAVLQGQQILYTPQANYFGTDSFTYEVQDSHGAKSTAVVGIQVVAVNDRPVINSQSFSAVEDLLFTGQLLATDVDGDPLTYIVVSSTTQGALSVNATGGFTYQSNLDFVGTDTFVVKVNDGQQDSLTATITLQVTGTNDTPVASNQNLTTVEDTDLNLTLAAVDDDINLTYTIQTQPLHGILLGNGTQWTYKPNTNFSGNDQFVFRATDSGGLFGVGVVSITVTPVNDPPSTTSQSFSTDRNQTLNSQLVATDPENQALTFTILSQPASGTLTLTNANLGLFTYVPQNNFNGTDSFTFQVSDGSLTSSVTTATINVHDNNTAPVSTNGTLTTDEDTLGSGTLSATDADGDVLTYVITTQGSKGLVTLVDPHAGTYQYQPYANLSGSDSFQFRVNDGRDNSNVSTVSVTITPVNDAPEAFDDAFVTDRNQAKAVVLVGFDIEGQSLTYVITQNPTKGVLTGSGNSYTYTPNAGTSGVDSFNFKVNDGNLDSNSATVDILINNTNVLPTATDLSFSLLEDGSLTDTLLATDADSDPLTFTITQNSAHGTVNLGANGAFTYTPTANFFGSDSFKFKVNDGYGDSNVATVTLTIAGVNDLPTTSGGSFSTEQNQEISVNFTAVDLDADSLSYIIVTPPTKGTLSGTGATQVYKPNLNQKGSDSFTFKVNDGTSDSNVSTITISIADNGNWAYPPMTSRQQISFNNTDIGATTNVPVLISLDSSVIDYQNFETGGADLRFTDAEGNALKYQINHWNTNGTSSVYVLVPTMAANSTVSSIWMYYNKPSAVSASSTQVWAQGTVAAYSLEDPGVPEDATGRNSLIQASGTQNQVAGIVASATQFTNGSYQEWGNQNFNLTNAVTISGWVYVNNIATAQTLLKQSNSAAGTVFSLSTASSKLQLTIGSKTVSSNTLTSGTWYYVAAVFNQATTNCSIYINGILHNQNTACSDGLGTPTSSLMLGGNFVGVLDEIKIDNVARSADFVRAQFLSTKPGYAAMGREQIKGDPVVKQMLLVINHTNNDGEVDANGVRTNAAGSVEQGQSNTLILIPNEHWGYYRFALNEALPAGANVLNTKLKLYGTGNSNWDPNASTLSVWLQDSANAGQISGNNQYPGAAGINLVNTGFFWQTGGLPWMTNQWNETDNLNSLMQTLVNNQGGLSQNAYVQVWVTRGTALGGILTGIKKVAAEDYSNNNFYQAQLLIEWQ